MSAEAWNLLAHGHLCWQLASCGVDALVLKGPSLTSWLYAPGERIPSSDVDVLVGPSHARAATRCAQDLGYAEYYAGLAGTEVPGYACSLRLARPGEGDTFLDLHTAYPGIGIAPESSFQRLWSTREEGAIAGVPVWFPSKPARALIVALHVARDPGPEKSHEDLRRAWQALGPTGRQQLAELAHTLDAAPALRAGLEAEPSLGRSAVAELGLSHVAVPPEWALLSGAASGTTMHLFEVSRRPWRQRPRALAQWAFPSPALMRLRDPRATGGRVPLARAYAERIWVGTKALPGAWRRLRDLPPDR